MSLRRGTTKQTRRIQNLNGEEIAALSLEMTKNYNPNLADISSILSIGFTAFSIISCGT
jgi:hypothetical protein